MSEEFSLSKKTTIENLRQEIKRLEGISAGLHKQVMTELDSDVKVVRQKKLNENENDLNLLRQEYNTLLEEKKKTLTGSLQDLIKNTGLDPLHHNHLAYLASEDSYVLIKNYSTTKSTVNIVERKLNWNRVIGACNLLCNSPGKFNDMSANDLRTAFEKANASYMLQTSSFNEPKWDKSQVFNTLNIQRTYWAPIDGGTNYAVYFDDLIYTLGGGKKENIDYIEKWVAFKFLFPEKVKTTPNLNITGQPGGNGKGMFALILSSIFTQLGVSLIRSKNISGGFNALMNGKVVLFLDDEQKEKFPQAELKQSSGNGSIIIENKGVDAFSVDSTASIVVTDNIGLVKLVGGGSGGEDRRWSIIKTELALLAYLEEKYTLDNSQSKHLAEKIAEIFEDRVECGKWLAAMIEKHNVRDMVALLPLHGQDYTERLAEQKDNWTGIFEAILPIIANQGVMPFKFIKEIVETETGEKIKNATKLSSAFSEFMSRRGYKNMERADINMKITWPGVLGGTSLPFKGTVRRIDQTKSEFDYSLISNTQYSKKAVINKETLQLTDFTGENVAESQDSIPVSLSRCLAEIDDRDEILNEINDLQSHDVSETGTSCLAEMPPVSLKSPRLMELMRSIRAG